MTDTNGIRIFISSPPDREFLVAEIFIGNEQIAEINQENKKLQIEIYSKKSGESWKADYKELIKAFDEAKQRLAKRLD